MIFDKSKPYGSVSGVVEEYPTARYSQGGAFFNNKFEYLGGSLIEVPPAPASIAAITAANLGVDIPGSGLHNLSWRELRDLVVGAGGEYTTKSAAIEFLEGESG